MEDYVAQAKQIIEENIYCTVSTASLKGSPWISPVFFSYDEDYNIYWVSYINSLHSKLLRKNPQAAIVIFNSTAKEGEGDGVYFEVKVVELSREKEILKAINIMNRRVTVDDFRIKSIDEVMDKGVWRIYKAIPKKVSKLSKGKFINGQYIDNRVEINLNIIK